MIENKKAFSCGLTILIISIVSMFLPMTPTPLYSLFVALGTIAHINVGILFLLGGIWDSEKTEHVAFGIGIPTWAFLIIGNIMGVIWAPNLIAARTLEYNLSILLFLNSYDPYFLIGPIFVNAAKAEYIGTIIDLGIAITSFILGMIAYHSVQEKF
ncbi:MAG: hypothetical protein ACTSRG_14255 [Candidatus Helarchaeota archaeon]